MARARVHAKRALALDPSLAAAHVALGEVVHWSDYDASGALARYDHAIGLDPRDPLAHELRGYTLISLGRLDEAVSTMRHAVSLDPLSPGPVQGHLVALSDARRWEELVTGAHRAAEAMPYYGEGPRMLGTALLFLGRPAEAVPHFERVVELTGRHWWGMLELARSYALVGRRDAALALLAEVRGREGAGERAGWISPFNVACVHAALGDVDAAFLWLERALEARDFRLVWAHADPALDALRADGRLSRLLERVGVVQQAWAASIPSGTGTSVR
jgi:tetratricopeptide (TPR) repeat protein